MAQISIIKQGDILEARRFDAEYFKPEYLEIERKLNTMDYEILDKYCNFCKKGIFDISPNYYRKKGIPLIRTSEIKHPFIDFSTTVFLDEDIHKIHSKTELEAGDLIFTKIGAYIGDVSILPPLFKKYNFSQNVAGLSVKKDKISPYFLLSFLLSKYSRKQILRITMLSGQGKLELKDIKNIKIPTISHSSQLQIEKIVKDAYQKQIKSKKLYEEAELLLLEEMELVSYKPRHSLFFEIREKEINEAKRFDSEYFKPEYTVLIDKIENYQGGFNKVKNLVKFNKKNFFPKENELYNYLPLSKVSNSGEIDTPEKELGKDLPTRARRKVKQGEVILSSISGSLETSAIIDKEHDGFIVSNGFYVFSSEKINPETLLLFFKSKPVIKLLKRISKGAILGGYDLTAFEELKIPLIKSSIQNKIAEKVKESYKLRKESKELLEKAKKMVEDEIEK